MVSTWHVLFGLTVASSTFLLGNHTAHTQRHPLKPLSQFSKVSAQSKTSPERRASLLPQTAVPQHMAKQREETSTNAPRLTTQCIRQE